MRRLWVGLGIFLFLLAGSNESPAAHRSAGDYSGYVNSRRGGRGVRNEIDVRIQEDGKVILSVRQADNRAVTLGEFKGSILYNGRFILTGSRGRIMGAVKKGSLISGNTIIDGVKGTLSAHPFVWFPPMICACFQVVGPPAPITPLYSTNISGSVTSTLGEERFRGGDSSGGSAASSRGRGGSSRGGN